MTSAGLAKSLWRRFMQAAAKARSSLLLAALAAALAGTGYFAVRLVMTAADNRTIAALRAGHDVAPAKRAADEVVFARIHFLLSRDAIDEAQGLVDTLDTAGRPELRARARYNLANARMRLAFDRLEGGRIGDAEPLVNLARADYRRAISLDPSLWDARYNLDVAMRLIRDFPGFEESRGDEAPPKPGKLWTDLPGKPRGLP